MRPFRSRGLLLCSAALLATATVATAAPQQAQLTDAEVLFLGPTGAPVDSDLVRITDAEGQALPSFRRNSGAYVFTNVGQKLSLEFTAKGLKESRHDIILEPADRVYLQITMNPISGRIKSIQQKPVYGKGDVRRPKRKNDRRAGFGPNSNAAQPLGSNDDCLSATPIACDSSAGGDTSLATTAVDDPGLSCHFSGPGTQVVGSLWYTFVATGTEATVDTELSTGSTDTLIGVYEGTCGAFTEIGCSEDEGTGLLSIVTVATTPGETYYVQVGSFSEATAGEITVSLACGGGTGGDGNDECADALEILCGGTAEGDTSTATTAPDDPGLSCHFSGPGTQGIGSVWYFFVATGTEATLDTNSSTGSTDTLIGVYDGSCGALTEIGCSEDEGVGLLSEVTVTGLTPGNTYYVAVSSFSEASAGAITLALSCGGGTGGGDGSDECADAPEILCGGTASGDTSTATTNPTDPGLSCHFSGPGTQGIGSVWFFFVATGSEATLDTNASTGSTDTLIGVYDGSCGSLVEIGCSEDEGVGLLSEVTVTGLTPGNTYYVAVSSFSEASAGAITLALDCGGGTGGGNDECADALEILCGGTAEGDTSTATTAPDDPGLSCHFSGPGTQGIGSVWYFFVATTNSATLDTELSTGSTDTLIGVYDGSCGALTEIGCSEDEGTGLLSIVTVNGLIPGNTYYVAVSSFSEATAGAITLSLTCEDAGDPPVNDDCSAALDLNPGDVVTFDNTLGTDDIVGPPCGVASGPFKNVWYSVTGTGNTMTVTTCSAGTIVTDTKISVFCGSCDDLQCVDGNDDDCAAGGPGFASTVSWCSQAGVEYLVTVGNFSDVTTPGVIEVSLSDDGVACGIPAVQCLPVGACCLDDGSCVIATVDDCAAQGGEYQGDGVECVSNAVVDGSFEAGAGAGTWAEFSSTFGTPLCTLGGCGAGGGTGPNTGDWWAWFGGIAAPETGSMEQSVVIPAGASTLDFAMEIPVTSGNGVDFLNVLIDGNNVLTVLESDGPILGYQAMSVPLGGFADGAAHTIRFESTITGLDAAGGAAFTNFFVDDVSISTQSVDCRTCDTLTFEGLGNGHEVAASDFNGQGVSVSSVSSLDHYGAALFDSDPAGPNAFSQDPDLLVDTGNLLILQESGDQTVSGTFDNPDDAQLGGTLVIDFLTASEVLSVDLVDIDLGPPIQNVTVTLIDGAGLTRSYDVPDGWTTDVFADGPPGFATLDLTTLANQPGVAATATASEDAGFDASNVVQMTVNLLASGAIDNVVFCPAN